MTNTRSRKIVLTFTERDTAFERIQTLASQNGISLEQQAKRLLTEGLGGFGLRDPSDAERKQLRSLDDVMVASGVLKPRPPKEE